jgi:hypothetical protein
MGARFRVTFAGVFNFDPKNSYNMADDTITFLRINKEENNLQNKLELKKKLFLS